MRNARRARAGFTLVELLVVIGIIALLISILLPALGKARKTANTVKCLANLKSVTQAMLIYASQNKNYILGSPNTTGFGLLPGGSGPPISESNTPDVNSVWDWQTPVLNTMGIKIPYAATADVNRSNGEARWDRANYALNYAGFKCPENDLLATIYQQPSNPFPGAANVPAVVPFASYAVSLNFLWIHYDPAAKVVKNTANSYENPPAGYAPKLNKIGLASKKVFISDGARYQTQPIDLDYGPTNTLGGGYADWGPQSAYSHGHSRANVPGSGVTPSSIDYRLVWARHGSGLANGRPDSFRFNAAFFDGHAETMGDLQGADPNLWAPKGTEIPNASTEFYADVVKHYLPGGATGTYTVPY